MAMRPVLDLHGAAALEGGLAKSPRTTERLERLVVRDMRLDDTSVRCYTYYTSLRDVGLVLVCAKTEGIPKSHRILHTHLLLQPHTHSLP